MAPAGPGGQTSVVGHRGRQRRARRTRAPDRAGSFRRAPGRALRRAARSRGLVAAARRARRSARLRARPAATRRGSEPDATDVHATGSDYNDDRPGDPGRACPHRRRHRHGHVGSDSGNWGNPAPSRTNRAAFDAGGRRRTDDGGDGSGALRSRPEGQRGRTDHFLRSSRTDMGYLVRVLGFSGSQVLRFSGSRGSIDMRIFLTGGTGYVGGAVLDALLRGGHSVDALVRNSQAAAAVQARGATPVLGDLLEPASWRDAAAAADGAIHAAAEYGPRARQVDASAVDVLTSLPSKDGRFIVYTSGIWVLGPAPAPVDERATLNPAELVSWRPAHEQRVLDAAGVRPIVIRPGIVYGGSRGILADIFKDVANGLVRVVGNGDNHWPLIYERDLGELYLRVVITGAASGVYHANDEGDETVNDLVDAIGAHAKVRPSVRHVPLAEARQKMGPYADALALDQIVRSPRARGLGWTPTLHSVGRNAVRLFDEWRRGREAA